MLVLDNEVDPAHRYLGRAIVDRLPGAEYVVYPDDPAPIDLDAVEGVVLSGSSASVYDDEHEPWMARQRELVRRCVAREVPLVGICFGHQLINDALGGRVEHDERRSRLAAMTEYETDGDGILHGVEPVVPVVHGDVVTEPGTGLRTVARTDYDPHFSTRHRTAPVWTVQFHPEFRPEFVDELDSWTDGPYSFESCNAVRVLDNVAGTCR